MKRNDMLSKIASVIINYNEAHCVINRDKAMEMAETILGIQEENFDVFLDGWDDEEK